jgi:hypothetical protein
MSTSIIKTHLHNIKNNLLALKANDFYELCLPSILFAVVGILTLMIGISEKRKYVNLKIDKFVIKKEYLDLFVLIGFGYVIICTILLNIICKIGYATVSWFLTGLSALFFISLFLIVYVFKIDIVENVKALANAKRCKQHNMNAMLCQHIHKNEKKIKDNHSDSDSDSD